VARWLIVVNPGGIEFQSSLMALMDILLLNQIQPTPGLQYVITRSPQMKLLLDFDASGVITFKPHIKIYIKDSLSKYLVT
jgi:hypothetical protein